MTNNTESWTRNSRNGQIWAFVATTGGGKTSALQRVYDANDRVIVWDARLEWREYDKNAMVVDDIEELAKFTRSVCKLPPDEIDKHVPKNLKICCTLPETKAVFNQFCGCIFLLGKVVPDLAIIVEELHMLTSKTSAPRNWQRCAQQSRQTGVYWFVTYQRGQKVDDDTFSATKIAHVSYIAQQDDRRYLADKLGVRFDDLPSKQFTFVHVVPNVGVVCRGRSRLVRGRVVYDLYNPKNRTYKKTDIDLTGRFLGVNYNETMGCV